MEKEKRLELLLKKKQEELKQKKSRAPIELFFHQIQHCDSDIFNRLKSGQSPQLITELNPPPSKEEILENQRLMETINTSRAIAIITETSFNADINNLYCAGRLFRLPVLHIDYHIEPYQMYESRFFNAGMVMLSMTALSMVEITELFLLSREMGMETILNITSRRELDLAFNTAANFFGIDRENYFGEKLEISEIIDLVQYIPKDKFAVCRLTEINAAELQDLIEAEIDFFILPPPENETEMNIIRRLFQRN
jgi:indole-3-glycerol phosphate synthase